MELPDFEMNIELTPSSMTDSYSDLVSEPIEVKKQVSLSSSMEPCRSNIMLGIRESTLVMGENDCLVTQLQMPELSGNHPHLWISRMERFCCANKHTEDEKLNMILRMVTITLQDEEMVHRADYIQEEESCEAKSSNLTNFVFVSDVELMMQMTKSSCEYLLEESWSCAIDSMNRALSRIDIGSDVLLMGVDHLSSK
ncbi:hypothetical protein F2Q70_00017532 [Brassica cretica]|uniref:Uncharacterized protein n=1 Tax=Brassica cretica TaxID=69181 RepID=A0A8S9KVK7_BRACR|nr:hypothetical protein F2Q70_00017532 [Brassica cretica]KAF2597313.1 hypothetical protein F2Q68_00010475 [Brassica cretica]